MATQNPPSASPPDGSRLLGQARHRFQEVSVRAGAGPKRAGGTTRTSNGADRQGKGYDLADFSPVFARFLGPGSA